MEEQLERNAKIGDFKAVMGLEMILEMIDDGRLTDWVSVLNLRFKLHAKCAR